MKKLKFLVTICVLLVLSSCCTNPEIVYQTQDGNTPGNIANSGYVTEDEHFYYYAKNSVNTDILYAINKDSGEGKEIATGELGFTEINVWGDYIYFTNGSPGKIIKMPKTGGRQTAVTRDLAGNVIMSRGRIYYRESGFDDDWGKLYSCDLDGGKKKLLAEEVLSFCVDGSTVYYSNMQDGDSLWAMETSGENKRKLIDKGVLSLNFDEKYVYYIESNGFNILRTDKETLSTETINNEKCEEANLSGDYIYYRNLNDNGSLYRISNEGSVKEKLADGNAVQINVVADRVFFERVDKDAGAYILNLRDMSETRQ